MATNVKRKKKAEVMSDDGSMTLTGHLKELRNRLIICAAVFVVGVIGFLAISDKLIDLLTAMAMNANYTFVFLAPQEKLMQYFRVSLIAAVIVTIPVALYQVYAFAKPGLKRSESFFFKLVLLLGLMLFCVGILFAYKVTLPFMLNFLVTLEGTDYITASISIESYINLCLTMFIIFGCVFEMPLVTIILAKMGIANPEIMKKGRGVAIVLIFLVAAIITPPDIVSQCFVAVPMCLLYFISIFLSGIFYKPKTDDDDEDDEDSAAASAAMRSGGGGGDPVLLSMLKDLRKDLSRRLKLQPWIIFGDPSLEDMSILYPETFEELKNCQGVGEGKARKFGGEFISLIKRYVEENDIVRPDDFVVKTTPSKSADKPFIIQSIDRRMSLEDIAEARNMDMEELMSEIEAIVASGMKLDLDYYIEENLDADIVEDIYRYFKEDATSDDVQAAMDALGPDYYENEIRLVRIKFLCEIAS